MGKEWLYWGGGGGVTGMRSTKKARARGGEEKEVPPSGCMCAVLQLFDLPRHNFPFPLHQSDSSFLQEDTIDLKGVEAPRNSLELEGAYGELGVSSLSSTMKDEENLNIPMSIQIKTSCETRSPRASTSKAKSDDFSSSECSSSPGTKTPNLVARLMGLDLLPEGGSPSYNLSASAATHSTSRSSLHPQVRSQKQDKNRARYLLQNRSSSSRNFIFENDTSGTRSLPETPRISSARRSDVDHRLSLQINKENIAEEFEFSTYPAKIKSKIEKRRGDENRSPGHYARQIVKQVKESVSRKVGRDITNTIKDRGQVKEDNVVLLKPRKPSGVLSAESSSTSRQSTPSCSPRLRFSEPKNTSSPVTQTHSFSPRLSPLPSISEDKQSNQVVDPVKLKTQVSLLQEEQQKQQENSSVKNCKRAGVDREIRSRQKRPAQAASDGIRNKKEEPFVRATAANKANLSDKKSKKTPLSNELLNILPVKKDSSPLVKKLPEKRVSDAPTSKKSTRLSSSSSHSLTVQENSHDRCNGAISGDGAEFQYVERILKRTGIDRGTPVSLAKWYSPSHPLDPSVFHHLELFQPITAAASAANPFSWRCNRKLIFQLVDELLVGILRPFINFKPWVTSNSRHSYPMNGSELIDILCMRIRSFPSANCQVLEDIDALIDKDLSKREFRGLKPIEEEEESMVSEIERYMVESLVHETAIVLYDAAVRT